MNNSAGKITLKENLLSRQYSVALINLILAIFIITMKNQTTQNRNEKKKKRFNTCHIYLINAWNRSYLISYQAFFFLSALSM